MKTRRILFVAPPVGPIGSGGGGGLETHLIALSPVLADRGYEVGIVAPAASTEIPGARLYPVAGTLSASATRAERPARTAPATGGVLENMWQTARKLFETNTTW